MLVDNLRKARWLVVSLPFSALLALGLAWVSTSFSGFDGWLSFWVVLLLMGAVVWMTWRALRHEDLPRWLLTLVLLAAFLRLALGVFWFLSLPVWGYENDVQQAGYVMRDAFERDTDAWEMAQSDQPLSVAFRGSAYDQYGGLLFGSALLYRYLGTDVHQPLLVVVVTAFFSALAVIYCWLFSRKLWGERVALLAAWFLALYPEAMLLGSAQMREAFMVTLTIALVYYLYCFWHSREWRHLAVSVVLMLVSAAISFPFAGWLFLLVVLLSLVFARDFLVSQKYSWVAIFLVMVAVIVFYWTNQDWITKAGGYQLYLTWRGSGHLQELFKKLPRWLWPPFIVIYGIFRPLLPAALIARSGSLLWQIVAIWRSLGWTCLLLFLIYASFLSLKNKSWYKAPGVLLLVNWIFILAASYRGGGDDWDNPRYRVAVAGVQVALVAWALVHRQERKDPWLRRFIGLSAVMVFWVLLWYAPRYFTELPWSAGKPLDAVGLGFVSGVLYLIWDLVRGERILAS